MSETKKGRLSFPSLQTPSNLSNPSTKGTSLFSSAGWRPTYLLNSIENAILSFHSTYFDSFIKIRVSAAMSL